MLFKDAQIDGIRRGTTRRTYRRWKSARVRAGAVYTVRPGLAIRVTRVEPWTGRLTARDAALAGCESVAALEKLLGPNESSKGLWCVDFEATAPPVDARRLLAATTPTDADVDAILTRLAAMDGRSSGGPWTARVLTLIESQPARRAADLAAALGWETVDLKTRVRRLKALGLTESLEVGYRLSPRGRAVAAAVRCS